MRETPVKRTYHGCIVKPLAKLAGFLVLALAVSAQAQVRQRVPTPEEGGDFGSKFFDDLRGLFGKLLQSELDRAFQRARPAQCQDLISQKGEWKQVAFLNDDRTLGDFHYTNIDEVKNDPVQFVFAGACRTIDGPVKVYTSYPVEESYRKYRERRIPFSQVVVSDNDPVSVMFDKPTDTYVFQLPYLYLERKDRDGALYTLTPPLLTSRPDSSVSEEFRCKALSDPELTYRFMLCRTRVVDRDERLQAQKRGSPQPLGNAAYYILSDGKEASSTVKLSFGDDVAPVATTPSENQPLPEEPAAAAGDNWKPTDFSARLIEIAGDEFRLHFTDESWTGRVSKPQILTARGIADAVAGSRPDKTREYCSWTPDKTPTINGPQTVFWLTFRKNIQSVTSAVFDMENSGGTHLGSLECFFPKAQTPSDITVERFESIVGPHLRIEVRGHHQ